ncbi:MAG: hypothetical protein A2Y80_02070 [Deltaproteobacteria bacterium RBG_13_58_19]|nr:MAG: hypothetical protein A2Y80_02070 [Deltaproteobacteria bacterium RBG_13_58_19]
MNPIISYFLVFSAGLITGAALILAPAAVAYLQARQAPPPPKRPYKRRPANPEPAPDPAGPGNPAAGAKVPAGTGSGPGTLASPGGPPSSLLSLEGEG